MAVNLEFPVGLEAQLRCIAPDLEAETRTAIALDLFRRELISLSFFGKMLGMDRFEASRFLKERGETAQMLTLEDLEADYQTAKRLFAESGR